MRPASRKAAAGGETAAGSPAELIDATGTVANCARAGGRDQAGTAPAELAAISSLSAIEGSAALSAGMVRPSPSSLRTTM